MRIPGEVDWDKLGDDRIRRWPHEYGGKRPIRVTINSWVGTSAIGARHYYLEVEEEENQWWCEKENSWVTFSMDLHNKGREINGTFEDEESAIELARKAIELLTKKDLTHFTVTWSGPGCPRWILKAQGHQ
jgi:hypothetical protein